VKRKVGRALGAVRALVDPGSWSLVLRVISFLYEGHVRGRRQASIPSDVRVSPTATFRNGHNVSIGARTHIGESSSLWAGETTGRIDIGADVLFGPRVYVTASNYGTEPGTPVMLQAKLERSVRIGDDCWLGAGVTVLPGVTIGDGCIVGAGAVVTKDLPPGSIAVGVPARVVGKR
jgi:acetyltransferase-like isoleucine patch superfamily enzyme